jgi:hypothetical protein
MSQALTNSFFFCDQPVDQCARKPPGSIYHSHLASGKLVRHRELERAPLKIVLRVFNKGGEQAPAVQPRVR